MRRIRLYREGVPSNDGRRLDETYWADESLPLMVMDQPTDPVEGHSEARIVGKVVDVQREDEGWVTGLLDYDGPVGGLAAEADFDHVEESELTDEVMIMRGARLRAIVLGTSPCWDDMVIEP